MNRRRFLKDTAIAALSGAGVGAAATLLLTPTGCSSNSGAVTSSTNAALPCDGAGADSSIDQGHSHAICVPLAAIEAPPAGGATFTTTFVNGHTHDLPLAQAQLQGLAAGQAMTMTTASVDSHTHTFVLQRALPNAATPSSRG